LSMTFFQAKNNQYQKSLSLMFLHIVPTNEEMFVNPNNKYQILFTYMECKRNMSKELRIESKHFEESFN
jgi:gamma-glutamylcysteine synthetase